jgi:hypothetical protein
MDYVVTPERSPAARFFGRSRSTRTADCKQRKFPGSGNRLRVTCIAALMAASTMVHALAQSATKDVPMSAECTELNQEVMTQFANGQSPPRQKRFFPRQSRPAQIAPGIPMPGSS